MQSTELLACFQPTMFLRAKIRKKDGKLHRYFSVVENRRVGTKRRTVQRTVGTNAGLKRMCNGSATIHDGVPLRNPH